ncbi:hypothetical protein KC19_7G069500 [Ceratodon purpureus]|uniref:Tyrosine specific protein phosphatases domain-containing protein n=1 Tax=Ceratodon purpureus TaxID=3225 RepID=A0A8T0H8E8_CERPU|nr:hypothetical protein KC19_7G069500 [Ceratodon purpureus]
MASSTAAMSLSSGVGSIRGRGYGCIGLNSSWKSCPAFLRTVRMSGKGLGVSMARVAGGSGRVLCAGEGGVVTSSEREVEKEEEVAPMSEAERAGWEQRQKEATEVKDPADPFQWRWTLNWDSITPNIIVGSCPRSPGDVDRMVDEAGIDAILNLQSGLCFDALKIPIDAIRKRAVERGVRLERVEIRDFDHADQSLMLPVAVRLLNSLLARGMKVYVHCTAGINRATLTTVGHLTFVQQMDLDEAVELVKSARPVAHPYIDCWTEVRRRLLDGRLDEVTRTSEQIYEDRVVNKITGTKNSDWFAAEKRVISQTFQRYLDTDLAVLDMETEWLKRRFELEHKKTGGNGSAH